jgi:uncharacterized protein YbaA (DUF1428 family)
MNYVDIFLCSVSNDKRTDYLAHANATTPIFKEFGALSVLECWGDDVPEGKLTSLPMAVKCEPNETVVFSMVTWVSKAERDAGWAKVMADPRFESISMPFDGKRMIFGGFDTMIAA